MSAPVNGISFCPTVLEGCTVTDGHTDHATVTSVAIGRIAIVVPPKNGHNFQDIEDTQMEMVKSPFRTSHFHFDVLSPKNPRKCPHKPYTAEN